VVEEEDVALLAGVGHAKRLNFFPLILVFIFSFDVYLSTNW
jgi:hypothetical protein